MTTPAELMALDRPMLCSWCSQRPALVGDGSQYCFECDAALHPQNLRIDDRPVVYDGSELETEARYPQLRGDQYAPEGPPDWLDESALSYFEEGGE